MKYGLPLTLLALAACAPEGEHPLQATDSGFAALPADQAPVVLNSSPEWDRITDFDNHPSLGIGALYGRATARISVGNSRCSASLIDDDILITADHCGSGTLVANFGEHPGGVADARLRLRQMGVPAHVEASLPDSELTRFTCSWDSRDGTRDVSYWECDGNDISWTSGSHTYDYRIMPGHIWGHYNIRLGTRPDGRDVYAVSVNRTCAHNSLNTVLSPGEVDDSEDNCNSNHTGCFDVTTDWTGGSSGGLIVDKTDHYGFGIINGNNRWWAWGDPDDPCDRWSAANNTGSYISRGIYQYVHEDQDGGGWSVGDWTYSTDHVGATTGQAHTIACPEDMLVAGVVGSTASNGYVGNLGLVCVPHNRPERLRMDRATVIAGGSIDTDFSLSYNMDFNTYMHEVLSDTAGGTGVQTLAMCPAGSFVYRIQTKVGRFVNKVTRLYCKDPQNGKSNLVVVSDGPGGTGNIGTITSGSWDYAGCSSSAYLAGFTIHHGWLTDGFRGHCRYED